MKRLFFVWCHGFAFDASYWRVLHAQCAAHAGVVLDLGYFSAPAVKLPECVWSDEVCLIGVGHSLGFIKLLQMELPFACLIGLNAFRHFLGSNPIESRRRERELAQLIRTVQRTPLDALQAFYQRAGGSASAHDFSRLNIKQLLVDLASLSIPHQLQPDIPMLILGTQNDKIVPPALIWDNFSQCPQVTVEILAQGQHALGYLQAAAVYERMMSFIDANP